MRIFSCKKVVVSVAAIFIVQPLQREEKILKNLIENVTSLYLGSKVVTKYSKLYVNHSADCNVRNDMIATF